MCLVLSTLLSCAFLCVLESSSLLVWLLGDKRYTGHLKWCRAPICRHLGPSSPAGTLHQGEVRVHHGQVPVQ